MTYPQPEKIQVSQEHLNAVNRIFVDFGDYYGQRWLRNFKDPKASAHAEVRWATKLQRYPVATIDRAVNEWCNHNPSYAPGLSEILDLCKQRQGPWLGASAPRSRDPKALTYQPGDGQQRTVNEWRDHIRQQVGLKPIHNRQDADEQGTQTQAR